MGIKIVIVNYKFGDRICVTFDSLQYKRRCKSFRIDERSEALDFANSLADRYITGIDESLHDYAYDNNHAILKKYFSFA